MSNSSTELTVRVAGTTDLAAIARLRSLLSGVPSDSEFEQQLAEWMAREEGRRTTWLARVGPDAVGMASVFEYRRMPRPGRLDSRWGYLGNMFVRDDWRNQGIGSALLAAVIAAADQRGYARLVLSPTDRSVRFYERAGFTVADGSQGAQRLLVRASRPSPSTA
jgi:GNAT superfamily N-acetyltransferase